MTGLLFCRVCARAFKPERNASLLCSDDTFKASVTSNVLTFNRVRGNSGPRMSRLTEGPSRKNSSSPAATELDVPSTPDVKTKNGSSCRLIGAEQRVGESDGNQLVSRRSGRRVAAAEEELSQTLRSSLSFLNLTRWVIAALSTGLRPTRPASQLLTKIFAFLHHCSSWDEQKTESSDLKPWRCLSCSLECFWTTSELKFLLLFGLMFVFLGC